MNEQAVKEALEVIEGEAGCLREYGDYLKAMDLIDKLKEVLKFN